MASTVESVVICCIIIVQMFYESDSFASTTDMESLVQTQGKAIEGIEDYIAAEMDKINLLKRLVGRYKQEHDKALKDLPYYLQNPINAFSLIKRLTYDLEHIENVIDGKTDYKRSSDVKFPGVEDWQAAAEAIGRLQVTYNLNIPQLSSGILKTNYSHDHQSYEEKFAPMSSSDCFEVGRSLYEDKHYAIALPWLLQALALNSDETDDDPSLFNDMDILELICFSYIEIGNTDKAVAYIKALLLLQPKYISHDVPSALVDYPKMVEQDLIKKKYILDEEPFTRNYRHLCRGDIDVPADITKRLSCHYQTETHPYLRLAPFKVEQLYVDPAVLMYHDVITQREIEAIKGMVESQKRDDKEAGALHTGIVRTINDWISKAAWLLDSESDTVARISRRIHQLTGLALAYTEPLQVANHGFGSFYENNQDFSSDNVLTSIERQKGATILFYMSNVTQGGATVFVDLKLTVYPVKGAAILWTNWYDTGAIYSSRYSRLEHADCPVLRGTKWVASKLLQEPVCETSI